MWMGYVWIEDNISKSIFLIMINPTTYLCKASISHVLPPCPHDSRSQQTADAISYASQALSVIVLTGVNLMLPWLLSTLTKMERPPTESQAAQSLTFSLFIMYFLNSSISYIIASTYFPSANTSGSALFFAGYYSDFTPGGLTDESVD